MPTYARHRDVPESRLRESVPCRRGNARQDCEMQAVRRAVGAVIERCDERVELGLFHEKSLRRGGYVERIDQGVSLESAHRRDETRCGEVCHRGVLSLAEAKGRW